jgi:hypothetical protein
VDGLFIPDPPSFDIIPVSGRKSARNSANDDGSRVSQRPSDRGGRECDAGVVLTSSASGNIDPMKSYVMTTGAVFGLLTLAHIARAFAEGPRLATDATFVLITVAAAALCIWACRLLRRVH